MENFNVLSLFDGMSCAMIALNKLGIVPDNYFASEIDKYAIQVSKANWPEIQHIGDVTKVHYKNGMLHTQSGSYKISFEKGILAGGSPCQGFSFAGKQLNFEDPRSKLFFEFVRVLKEVRAEHPKLYFFLENVVMKKEYQAVISEALGVQPILINSALVSAQNRKRLYWTNIPFFGQPADRGILLKHILEEQVDDKYFLNQIQIDKLVISKSSQEKDIKIMFHRSNFRRNLQCYNPEGKIESLDTSGGGGRFPCVVIKVGNTQPSGRGMNGQVFHVNGKAPTLTTNKGEGIKVTDGYMFRRLTPVECERLQTLPDYYTKTVSNSQKYTMLGNGWNVDTIVHLFEPLLAVDIL